MNTTVFGLFAAASLVISWVLFALKEDTPNAIYFLILAHMCLQIFIAEKRRP